MTRTTDADSRVVGYAYNALGQLTSENWFADTGTSTASNNTISYTYANAGELSTATDSFGSSDSRNSKYTFTTNALGWVTQVDNNGGSTSGTAGVPDVVLKAKYDLNGNRTALNAQVNVGAGLKDDFQNSYSFDRLNRETSVLQQGKSGGYAVGYKRTDLSYYNDGRLQSVLDYTANLAAGTGDRASWLADLATNSNQAIAAAQAALAAANSGGDPNQVASLDDVALPGGQDLGSVSVGGAYYAASSDGSLGASSLYWNGLSIGGSFGDTWGDPVYAWDNDGAYGSGTSYSYNWAGIGASAWWGNQGMVAPNWAVFDPFTLNSGGAAGQYFAGGFAGLSYGLSYGASFGYWYGNWGFTNTPGSFSWLPNYAMPVAPRANEEPTDAVQQEQTGVFRLSGIAAEGADQLAPARNTDPLDVDSSVGTFDVEPAAGFTATSGGHQPQVDGGGLGTGAAGQSVREALAADVANPPSSQVVRLSMDEFIRLTESHDSPRRMVSDNDDESVYQVNLANARMFLDAIQHQVEGIAVKLELLKPGDQLKLDDDVVAAIEATLGGYWQSLQSAYDAWVRGRLSADELNALNRMPPAPCDLTLNEYQLNSLAIAARNAGQVMGWRIAAYDHLIAAMKVGEKVGEYAGYASGAAALGSLGFQVGKTLLKEGLIQGVKKSAWIVGKTAAVVGGTIAGEQVVEGAARTLGASEQTIRGMRLASLVVGVILTHRRAPVAAEEAAAVEAAETAPTPGMPIPGDADFVGPVAPGWRLTPRGMGAHMVERVNVRGRAGLSALDQGETPRFYPSGTPEAAGAAHVRLHQATRNAGIGLREGANASMSDADLLARYRQAYSNPSLAGIRGDLRTPNGQTVIATNLTPADAFDALMKWFAGQGGK